MNFNVMTYKELAEKYPQMKEDIEKLKADKTIGLNYNRFGFFALGAIIMYLGSLVM